MYLLIVADAKHLDRAALNTDRRCHHGHPAVPAGNFSDTPADIAAVPRVSDRGRNKATT